jgi:hypothetical protein
MQAQGAQGSLDNPLTIPAASFSSGEGVSKKARPNKWGRPILVSLALLLAILAALALVLLTRPVGPPTSWMASMSVGKERVVYYLHWGEDGGTLRGEMQAVLYANQALQITTWPFHATYDSQNSLLHMTFENKNETVPVLSNTDAKIAGDTLTLKSTGGGGSNTALAFHPASVQDYEQAQHELVSSKT